MSRYVLSIQPAYRKPIYLPHFSFPVHEHTTFKSERYVVLSAYASATLFTHLTTAESVIYYPLASAPLRQLHRCQNLLTHTRATSAIVLSLSRSVKAMVMATPAALMYGAILCMPMARDAVTFAGHHPSHLHRNPQTPHLIWVRHQLHPLRRHQPLRH
jgi:hypothetical protein